MVSKKEKSIDQQAVESMGIMTYKEKNVRIKRIQKHVAGGVFILAVIAAVVVSIVDLRIPEPSIELPMIKEYKSLPTGMTKK